MNVVRGTIIVVLTLLCIAFAWPLLLVAIPAVALGVCIFAGLFLLWVIWYVIESVMRKRDAVQREESLKIRRVEIRNEAIQKQLDADNSARELGYKSEAAFKSIGADLSPKMREMLAKQKGFSSWDDYSKEARDSTADS